MQRNETVNTLHCVMLLCNVATVVLCCVVFLFLSCLLLRVAMCRVVLCAARCACGCVCL